jgi:hypothetical protein
MNAIARAAVFAFLLAPALVHAQCEPAWLFEDSAPPAPPAAMDAQTRAGASSSFKQADIQKRFADPTAKSPTFDQLTGNWMLVARAERQDDGVYDRNGLMNKAGDPGRIFVASSDNPFVGPRRNALAYVAGVNYADGDSGFAQGFPVAAGDKSAAFIETFDSKNSKETRLFQCKLVAEGQLLCEVRRTVAFMGFSGEYQNIPKSAYTAYYGFSKTAPAR